MRFIFRVLGRLFRFVTMTLGLLALAVILATVAAGYWLGREATLPGRMVLVADLRASLPEVGAEPLLDPLGIGRELTVADVVAALDAAGRDSRVAGLVARLDGTSHGFAVAQELRDAVRRFRAGGKFAVAHAETFGELTPGNEGYYLATAFERIELQPVGLVGLTGLSFQVPHVRALLDRLGIGFEVGRRSTYKTALEPLTEPTLSPANREMLERILDDLDRQLVAGIAEGRRRSPDEARRLIDGGPYSDVEARDAGLVDGLRHLDEVLSEAGRTAAGAEEVSLDRYLQGAPAPVVDSPRVALVRAAGPIQRGDAGLGQLIAADTMAEAIAEAVADNGIEAILLRVDSPGGSAVASETIARQLRRAKAAGKPVIVSMGNTAASGGYWIAMDADRVVAAPATLTGSIGVIAGKPVLTEALGRLGVEINELSRGAQAGFWSVSRPYTPEGRARLERVLDQLYGSFKEGVGRGRDLPPDRVEALAQGQVWTGAMALERGLVDRVGGLSEALEEVRAALELPPDATLELAPFPRPQGTLGRLLDLASEDWPDLSALLRSVGLSGPATMPKLEVR